MQETMRESYYKKNYVPLEGIAAGDRRVVKKTSDGSLWVADPPVGGVKCTRRTLRSLTRSEAKQLGLA